MGRFIEQYGYEGDEDKVFPQSAPTPEEPSTYSEFIPGKSSFVDTFGYEDAAPEPPKPEPTKYVSASDYAANAAASAAQIAAAFGRLAKGLSNEEIIGTAVEKLGNRAVEYWNDKLSPEAKKQLAKEYVTEDPETGEWRIGEASKSPEAIALAATGSAPGTALGAGIGSGLTKVLQVFANPVARNGLIKAAEAGSKIAAKKLKFLDSVLGAVGFGTGEGVVGGAITAEQVEKQVKRLPQKVLDASERYQELLAAQPGKNLADRRAAALDALASEAASEAGWRTGITTALLGAPMGIAFGRLFGAVPATRALTAPATRTGAALLGAGGEALQEAAQGVPETLLSNLAVQKIDPSVKLTTGLGSNVVGGALAGGLIGGPMGFAAGAETSPEAAPKPAKSPLDRLQENAQAARDTVAAQGGDALEQELAAARVALEDQIESNALAKELRHAGDALQQELEEGAQLTGIARSKREAILADRAYAEATAAAAQDTAGEVEAEAVRQAAFDKIEADTNDRLGGVQGERRAMTFEMHEAAAANQKERDMAAAEAQRQLDIAEQGQAVEDANRTTNRTDDDDGDGGGGAPTLADVMPAEARTLATRRAEIAAANSAKVAEEAANPPKEAPLDKPAALVARIKDDTDLRADLEDLNSRSGWAQEGGKALKRPVEGTEGLNTSELEGFETTGWIPNEPWWDERPSGITVKYLDNAVKKALAGKKLTAKQHEAVNFLAMVADERRSPVDLTKPESLFADEEATIPDVKPAEVTPSTINESAQEAATSTENDLPQPTEAQKSAGNYRKGHINIAGIAIAVENPEGSTRSFTRDDGSKGESTLKDHYGYINRTEGKDGEQVDVFVNPEATKPSGAVVYHGSPHKFEAFELSKIGSGEGAQAQGYGLYFAENPKVAGDYARTLSQGTPASNVYHVNIPGDIVDNMLDWDAPVNEQAESVLKALKAVETPPRNIESLSREEILGILQYDDPNGVYTDEDTAAEGVDQLTREEAVWILRESGELLKDIVSGGSVLRGLGPHATGQSVYKRLAGVLGGAKNARATSNFSSRYAGDGQIKASKILNDAGIPGIKYFDRESRAAKEGTRNIVLFDEKQAKISQVDDTKGASSDFSVSGAGAATPVFIIDQVNQQTGAFDEHKVMMGYPNQLSATRAYIRNYEKGHKVGPVTELTMDEFKAWVRDGDLKAPMRPVRKSNMTPRTIEGERVETKKDRPGRKGMRQDEPRARIGDDMSPLTKLMEDYESGERDLTVTDLANEIDDLATSGNLPDAITDAVEQLRADKRQDLDDFGGRGDSDAYEQEFLDAVYVAIGTPRARAAATPTKEKVTHADVVAAVEPLLKEMPGLPVTVLERYDHLPPALLKITGASRGGHTRFKSSRGLYFPGTNEIFVFSENHDSVADAIETILHEGVAHYGVRSLVGEAQYPALMGQVYASMPEKARQALATHRGLDMNEAQDQFSIADEYVAALAEKPETPSVLQKIIDAVRKALRKAGVVKKWSDSDIKALLRESRKALQGKPLSQIKVVTEAEIAETGEVVNLEQRADIAIRQVQKRQNMVNKLKECMA